VPRKRMEAGKPTGATRAVSVGGAGLLGIEEQAASNETSSSSEADKTARKSCADGRSARGTRLTAVPLRNDTATDATRDPRLEQLSSAALTCVESNLQSDVQTAGTQIEAQTDFCRGHLDDDSVLVLQINETSATTQRSTC
jgi:hypothetical protein